MNWKAVHLKHDIIYQVGNIPSSAYLEVADPCWVEVKLQRLGALCHQSQLY